jgi:hypothetical protein
MPGGTMGLDIPALVANVWFHFVLAANLCFQLGEAGKGLIENAGVAVGNVANVWFRNGKSMIQATRSGADSVVGDEIATDTQIATAQSS